MTDLQGGRLAFESVLLDRILANGNLNQVLRPVETKNGAPGVNGIKVRKLRKYLKEYMYTLLSKSILDGTYRTNPVEI